MPPSALPRAHMPVLVPVARQVLVGSAAGPPAAGRDPAVYRQKVAFGLRDSTRPVLEVTATHTYDPTHGQSSGGPIRDVHVSIATQIGCRHNCVYCLSSTWRPVPRNLSLAQLVAQVHYFTWPAAFDIPPPAASDAPSLGPVTVTGPHPTPGHSDPIASSPPPPPPPPPAPLPTPSAPPLCVQSISLHGHGEPLDNPNSLDLLAFVASSSFPRVFGPHAPIPRTSVSTVGIINPLQQLLAQHPRTAVSWTLSSPLPDQRAELMPSVERLHPMHKVLPMLHAARHRGHLAPISIAYVLLHGINDSPLHLRALAKLASSGPNPLDPMPVSLIQFHPMVPTPANDRPSVPTPFANLQLAHFAPSPIQVVHDWLVNLDKLGIPVSQQQYFEFPHSHP